MKLPFNVDLKDKVCIVTGGGGIICASFARAVALCGAKVAVLDLNVANAQKVADEIIEDGGIAIAVEANVLKTESLRAAYSIILDKLGPCDILINGAGGNSPKGTTTKEYLFPEDLDNSIEEVKTFYDLDPEGVSFVFELNFLGTLLICFFALSDLFDGAMARISQQGASAWGGFLDSTLDRITDSAIIIAVLVPLIRDNNHLSYVLLITLVTGNLIPYIRAKAESYQIPCAVGIDRKSTRLNSRHIQ